MKSWPIQEPVMEHRKWRKSSYSTSGEDTCVEVADLSGGHRAVRDSKNGLGRC